MSLNPLRLGTRGSALALAQTTLTKAALASARPDLPVSHTVIASIGDKRPDLKLSEFSQGENAVVDKGIFTKELELALAARQIDAAVHSLKDVPTDLDEGFEIAAVLPRAPIEDVLIFKPGGARSLAELPAGATVATSSVRRQAQLRWLRPDLALDDIRGNVPTRIEKLLASDSWDAIMLARAGLLRLGFAFGSGGSTLEFQDHCLPAHVLATHEFLPAASQGAVAIETWNTDPSVADALSAINHPETLARIRCERHFLHLLQAGCQTPVGVATHLEGAALSLRALVFIEGEEVPMQARATGTASDPEALAQAVFDALA